MMGAPNMFALAMLWGWPAVAAALFAFLPPRRALVVGIVLGWLFLPMLAMPFPFVKYDKHAATSLGAVLGMLLFDPQRLRSFKPALIDLPMAVWVFVPYMAAVSNGLSPYDGSAASATEIVKWGVPYVLGRMYYGDAAGLRGLAVWTFVGGVLYIPFCLTEVAISPQLHFMAYGFYQHDFNQVIRMGGYRPMAFMQHGIAVGNMMAAASLAGFWLWWTGSLKTLFKMPVLVSVLAVLATTVACKSTGALLLAVLGIGATFMTRLLKNHLILILLCVVPFAYMGARSVGGWDGENLVQYIAQTFGEDRSLSLKCRFDNENILLKKAMEKVAFGWGPNGRNLVLREDGITIESIPDGLWVVAIGVDGVVGLFALFTAMTLPTLLMLKRVRPADWGRPINAGCAAVAALMLIHATDCLFNSMLNPIFLLGLGGLAGVAAGGQVAAPVAGFPVHQNRRVGMAAAAG